MSCQYGKCKALAEWETPFGKMCPYHFKVLKRKKGLTGEKIKINKEEKELFKRFKLMKNVLIKLKGGKNEQKTKVR